MGYSGVLEAAEPKNEDALDVSRWTVVRTRIYGGEPWVKPKKAKKEH